MQVGTGTAGTVFSVIQPGTAALGPSATSHAVFTVTFALPLNGLPNVVASVRNDPAFNNLDDTS